MHQSDQPKVSVLMLTYNHRKYVEQSLLSALQQQTDFEFEIVIADDCSTDGAPEVLRQMMTEFPGRLRYLTRSENLGLVRNFASAYEECRGEYVAILEGDDFWHNPNKLQRMVDYLDAHPELSFAFHDVRLIFDNGRHQNHCCPKGQREQFKFLDLLVHNPVPNCSGLMFRHRLISPFPEWFLQLGYYDWPLHVLHSQHGAGGYLAVQLSTYRVHSAGAWHGASPNSRLERLLELFEALDVHLNRQYQSIFEQNARFWRLSTEADLLRQRIVEDKRNRPRGQLKRLASGAGRAISGLVRALRSVSP